MHLFIKVTFILGQYFVFDYGLFFSFSLAILFLWNCATPYKYWLRFFFFSLKDYNTDEVLSLLCFGARSIPISHELRVNGVNSVLQGYRNCLETVTLGESRNFVPPIEHVVRTAKPHADRGDSYFILIIMTDGDITDVRPLAKVLRLIRKCSASLCKGIILDADPVPSHQSKLWYRNCLLVFLGNDRCFRSTNVDCIRWYWHCRFPCTDSPQQRQEETRPGWTWWYPRCRTFRLIPRFLVYPWYQGCNF